MCRPIIARASLRAISIASEPPGANQTFERPSGAIQPFGQRHRRLLGEPPRRERRLVQLRLRGGNRSRTLIAQVVDAGAMEIHVCAARPRTGALRCNGAWRRGLVDGSGRGLTCD
ncbi:MAG: hypothetical protein ACREJ5_13890 [Geminicoccaceae bacterium]